MEKTILSILILVISLTLAISILSFVENLPVYDDNQIKKFSSYNELKNFLEENSGTSFYDASTFGGVADMATKAAAESSVFADYSTTNIQVAGVDEADIVKNDGKYIYTISDNNVIILDAYPAENAEILSKIMLDGTPHEIFINGDKLVVFEREDYIYTTKSEIRIVQPRYYNPKTLVKVYDISDKTNPVLERNVSVEGNYFDSRMIGDYVYVIINQGVYYRDSEPIPLPIIYSGNKEKTISASDIYYFGIPDSSYIFTNMLAINTQDDSEELTSKTFLMGYTQNMYVSPDSIYVVYTKRYSMYDYYDKIADEAIIPIVPLSVRNEINNIKNSDMSKYQKMQEIGEMFENYLESLDPEQAADIMKTAQEKMEKIQQEIAKQMEQTIIHKISIDSGKIEYKINGKVPGHVLNQFSMDEYDGYFRIATTTGNWRTEQMNHVYILDDTLQLVGKLEDLAPGEKIYSVRFMGKRGYIVTFKKIDPLFVIDLADPQNPEVLGKLKIPGYSDYLHPYDENHIIGIGKEAVPASEEDTRNRNLDFAWYQGIKISLFDVTDVENPKEISKFNIGDRGTDSPVLRDHKAFLFNREKNLLIIPILLAEIDESKYPNGVPLYIHGDYVWQGAYVINLDLENGFELKGKITHGETFHIEEYYYDYSSQIKRSLYIDDVLYTVSDEMIKINSLEDLAEINKINLSFD